MPEAIEVSEDMKRAGVWALQEYKLGYDLFDLAEEIFIQMRTEELNSKE